MEKKDFFTSYVEDKQYKKKILEKFNMLKENEDLKEKLKNTIEQANSINNRLASENQTLKIKIGQQERRIFDLEDNQTIEIGELKKQLQEKSENAKKVISEKNKEIERLTDVEEKITNKFKDFLLEEFFPDRKDLRERPLIYLLDLSKEKKRFGIKPKQEEKLKGNPYSENYISEILCACGNEKSRNSKGCPSCKDEQDRIRKREGKSSEYAWKTLWKSLGIPMGN